MHTTRVLDVYDAAYLSGGLERVIDTAVVSLLLRESLRARSTGELTVVRDRHSHPVESAVLSATGTAGRTIHSVRRWMIADARVLAVADGLARDGLVSAGVVDKVLGRKVARRHPTAAGRNSLRDYAAGRTSGLDAASQVTRVALEGPHALADVTLRQAVFDSRDPLVPRSRRFPGWSAMSSRTSSTHYAGGGCGAGGGGCGGGGGSGGCGGGGGGCGGS